MFPTGSWDAPNFDAYDPDAFTSKLESLFGSDEMETVPEQSEKAEEPPANPFEVHRIANPQIQFFPHGAQPPRVLPISQVPQSPVVNHHVGALSSDASIDEQINTYRVQHHRQQTLQDRPFLTMQQPVLINSTPFPAVNSNEILALQGAIQSYMFPSVDKKFGMPLPDKKPQNKVSKKRPAGMIPYDLENIVLLQKLKNGRKEEYTIEDIHELLALNKSIYTEVRKIKYRLCKLMELGLVVQQVVNRGTVYSVAKIESVDFNNLEAMGSLIKKRREARFVKDLQLLESMKQVEQTEFTLV